jgi:hypothetical protein
VAYFEKIGFLEIKKTTNVGLSIHPAPVSSSEYDRLTSIKYVCKLEQCGGKFAMLAAEFRQWFMGL